MKKVRCTVDISSIRIVLVLAEMMKWTLRTCDVETAFLRAQFPEGYRKIYVRAPAIFSKFGL
eukprot:1201813-Amphidinium_carterae.1